MNKTLIILLIILLIVTTGCVKKYVSFRDTCPECDTNPQHWQECIYKCQNLSNHKLDYDVPKDWQLSYISKEKFTLIEDEKENISYNCICKFKKLNPQQSAEMNRIIQSNS